MSTASPTTASPSQRRDGGGADKWPEPQPSPYSYEYERPPPGGPQPPYYGGPPPSQYRGPPPGPSQDYWSYEPPRGAGGAGGPGPGYWGPPPPYEGGYAPGEGRMPPPPRVPRGPPPQKRPVRPYIGMSEGQLSPLRRGPESPNPYHRGPQGMPKREYHRHPPNMSGMYPPDHINVPKDKKTGDPLSILANVSAGMTGKDKEKQKQNQGVHSKMAVPPAPTSPLQRRNRPNAVITPSQASPDSGTKQRPPRRQITPNSGGNVNRPSEHSPPGPYWDHNEHFMDSPHGPGPYYGAPRRRPPYNEHGPPHHEGPPALVERGSFDSQGESPRRYHHRDGGYPHPPPGTPPGAYYYDEPPPYAGGPPGYWDNGPPPPAGPPRGPYPPPRWNYGAPPPGSYPPDYYPEYPPYEGRPEEEAYPPYPPPHHHPYHPQPPPHHAGPYTYVQLPRLEEKTVLRKKFSWKHYPELERFLIANRDEYLKHSSMNYTAEQKQYNNWLTEQLLEVAGKHHYVFDPDDFNFVAIRDRIRCYYKSYVQTARKRGLKLPEKKKD